MASNQQSGYNNNELAYTESELKNFYDAIETSIENTNGENSDENRNICTSSRSQESQIQMLGDMDSDSLFNMASGILSSENDYKYSDYNNLSPVVSEINLDDKKTNPIQNLNETLSNIANEILEFENKKVSDKYSENNCSPVPTVSVSLEYKTNPIQNLNENLLEEQDHKDVEQMDILGASLQSCMSPKTEVKSCDPVEDSDSDSSGSLFKEITIPLKKGHCVKEESKYPMSRTVLYPIGDPRNNNMNAMLRCPFCSFASDVQLFTEQSFLDIHIINFH